jgi:acetyl esterase/lipase
MRTRHLLSVAFLALSVRASADEPEPKSATPIAPETKPAPVTPHAGKKRDDPVAQIAATLTPTRQIVYKKVGDRELHLHIFEAKGHKAADQRACFVTIHGGGWTGGEARRMYPFAAHFADLGMVGISVEYRLLKPGVTVFDCVKDGRSAVRYVRAHAAELGVDPHRIIANGGSAGGHVAAATALFDGIDEAGEDTKVSCVPDALVLLYPVIDTSKEGYGNAKCGAQWQEISPVHHVRSGLPPTIVFHGTGDTVTPFKGAKAFHEAMLKAGNRCELDVNEGGKHGYLIFERALYDDTLRKTDAFLESIGFLKRDAK